MRSSPALASAATNRSRARATPSHHRRGRVHRPAVLDGAIEVVGGFEQVPDEVRELELDLALEVALEPRAGRVELGLRGDERRLDLAQLALRAFRPNPQRLELLRVDRADARFGILELGGVRCPIPLRHRRPFAR